jgi:hypothetical protein
MVGTDPFEVDRLLFGGALRCPDCTGELRPWGHARGRGVRDVASAVTLRPRRSLCMRCRCTHVLLPASTLVRGAETVVVIGQALLAKAEGAGHRRIAALLNRPVSTVRAGCAGSAYAPRACGSCSPDCSTPSMYAPRQCL